MLRYNPHDHNDTDVASYLDTERYTNRKRKGPIRPATPTTDYDGSSFAALRAIMYAQDLAAGYGPTDDNDTGDTLLPWKQYPSNIHKPIAYHAKDGNAYTVQVPQNYSVLRQHQPRDIFEQIPIKELYTQWYVYQHIYYSTEQTYEIENPMTAKQYEETNKWYSPESSTHTTTIITQYITGSINGQTKSKTEHWADNRSQQQFIKPKSSNHYRHTNTTIQGYDTTDDESKTT